MFTVDASQVIQAITSKIDFKDWLIWLAGAGHNGMHLFFSFPMQTQHSPDEPFFYLHHCNIDRFFHLWADCNGYDLIDSSVLGTNQFSSVNPTSGSAVIDPSTKQAAVPLLDGTIPMYWTGTTSAIFLPTSLFPTPRQLWSMGNATNPGWNGIWYRYGRDKIVCTFGSACINGGPWTWVNQTYNPQKRNLDTDMDTDSSTDIENVYYQTAAKTWNLLTEEQGMSPQDALLKMAMDACLANPAKPLTEEEKKHMEMMHISPEGIKRICDKDPAEEQLEPVETPDAGLSDTTHQGHSFRK